MSHKQYMDTQHIKTQLGSKQFKKGVICIIIGTLAVLIFSLGMQVGFMKASYSFQHGDNFYRSFGPMSGTHQMGLVPNDVSEAHGVSGKIISVALPKIVIADRDNTEKTVVIEKETVIRLLRTTVNATDLKAGDFVVIIGQPNAAGEIAAKLIRIMPTNDARVSMMTIHQTQ